MRGASPSRAARPRAQPLRGGLLRRRARRPGSDRPSRLSSSPTPPHAPCRDTFSRSPPTRRPVGSGSPTANSRQRRLRLPLLLQRPLDRLHDELANLERQLHAQAQRAACGIAPRRQRARVPRTPRIVHGVRLHVANLPAALLDLRRRRIERIAHQRVLIVQRRHTCQRPHLRVRQPPFAKRERDAGQIAQRLRRAHLLARRRQRDAATPRQPLGATREAPLRPAEPVVELAHQHEQPVVHGVDATREAADGRIDLVDRAIRMGRGRGRHGVGNGAHGSLRGVAGGLAGILSSSLTHCPITIFDINAEILGRRRRLPGLRRLCDRVDAPRPASLLALRA